MLWDSKKSTYYITEQVPFLLYGTYYNHTSYVLMLYCADVDTSIKKDLDTGHNENY